MRAHDSGAEPPRAAAPRAGDDGGALEAMQMAEAPAELQLLSRGTPHTTRGAEQRALTRSGAKGCHHLPPGAPPRPTQPAGATKGSA